MSDGSKKRPRDRTGAFLSVVSLDAADAEPISPDLASILAPLDVDEFMAESFRNKAVAVKVHPRLRERRLEQIKALMDGFNPIKMLQRTASDGISAWMFVDGAQKTQLRSFVTDAEAAKICFDAGHSLYFRANADMEGAFLPEVAEQLGFSFAANARDGTRLSEVEVFVAHPGHTTQWHYDFQENFTVQLKGRKKWYLGGKPVPHPHRACATHFNGPKDQPLLHRQRHVAQASLLGDDAAAAPDFAGVPADIDATCEAVILQPGDVLYHPAGMWHKVECPPCDENSLSINLSFMPVSWGDVVRDALSQLLTSHALFRERVALRGATEAERAADAQRQLATRLAALGPLLAGVAPGHVVPSVVGNGARRAVAHVAVLDRDGSATVNGRPVPEAARKAVSAAAALLRSPLAILSRSDVATAPPALMPPPPSHATSSASSCSSSAATSADSETGGGVVVECPAHHVRFDLCTNFLGEDVSRAATSVSAVLFVHTSHTATLAAIARLPPAKTHNAARLSAPPLLLWLLVQFGFFAEAS